MSDELNEPGSKAVELVQIITRYEAEAARFTEAANKAKEDLRALLPDYGEHRIGNVKVQFRRPSRKFSKAAFVQAHPFEKDPSYYDVTLNTKAIPENIYETYMVDGEGEGTVIIK